MEGMEGGCEGRQLGRWREGVAVTVWASNSVNLSLGCPSGLGHVEGPGLWGACSLAQILAEEERIMDKS